MVILWLGEFLEDPGMAFNVKQVTVGTSAVQLYTVIVRNVISKILVRAAASNTAKIWYGALGVEIGTGMFLSPGEVLEIPILRSDPRYPDETEYYLVSDAANQSVSVHAH